MADVENSDTIRPQLPKDPKQRRGFSSRKRGGRFVQDEQPAPAGEGSSQGHHLALGDGSLRQRNPGIELLAQFGEEFTGRPFHGGTVQASEASPQFATDKEIVDGVEIGERGGFLVDHGDSGALAGLDIAEGKGGAFQVDGAGVGFDNAGENPNKGGFSGAVFAAQRVDFARRQLQAHIAECVDSCEALLQVLNVSKHASGTGRRRNRSDHGDVPRRGRCGGLLGSDGDEASLSSRTL